MADGALTKADMAERLFEELGLNKREAKEVAPFVALHLEVARCVPFCVHDADA